MAKLIACVDIGSTYIKIALKQNNCQTLLQWRFSQTDYLLQELESPYPFWVVGLKQFFEKASAYLKSITIWSVCAQGPSLVALDENFCFLDTLAWFDYDDQEPKTWTPPPSGHSYYFRLLSQFQKNKAPIYEKTKLFLTINDFFYFMFTQIPMTALLNESYCPYYWDDFVSQEQALSLKTFLKKKQLKSKKLSFSLKKTGEAYPLIPFWAPYQLCENTLKPIQPHHVENFGFDPDLVSQLKKSKVFNAGLDFSSCILGLAAQPSDIIDIAGTSEILNQIDPDQEPLSKPADLDKNKTYLQTKQALKIWNDQVSQAYHLGNVGVLFEKSASFFLKDSIESFITQRFCQIQAQPDQYHVPYFYPLWLKDIHTFDLSPETWTLVDEQGTVLKKQNYNSHCFQAVLEFLGFWMRYHLEKIKPEAHTRVIITGGQTQHALWLTWKSCLLGHPLYYQNQDQAEYLGNFILAKTFSGKKTLTQTLQSYQKNLKKINPIENLTQYYHNRYQQYLNSPYWPEINSLNK